MSRCKACNAVMTDEDMCRKFPPDENGLREFTDLCLPCYDIAMAVLFNTYVEPEYDDLFALRGSHTMSFLSEDGE